MKKILIVSRNFFPQNIPRAFRTTELAREFASQGHEVTVITPFNTAQVEFADKYGIRMKDLGKMQWKPIEVGGSQGPVRLIKRILVRLLSLLILYPDSEIFFKVKKALHREKEFYDLLITIAAPHPVHWATAWVLSSSKKVANCWVADCGDPFMGGENDTFKRLFYYKYFEKWFCRKSDYITVPIESAIEAYYPEFKEKIRVIPQGFKFDEVILKKQLIKNACPTFAYAGSLIPRIRDPKDFFEFLCQTALPYKFFIFSTNKEYLEAYCKKSDGRIELRDPLPRLELLNFLQDMDFVTNFENIGAKQSPSKLIDYSIIQKPILSIKTFGFSEEGFIEFYHGNYSNAEIVENVNSYKIENVCHNFLELACS
jgi:hypothetical protein